MPEINFHTVNRLTNIVPDKLVNALRVHTRDGDFARNMFSEQFAYGHREILLKYCGISYSSQIIGNLQHGVYGKNESLDYRTPRFLGGRKSKSWVFSRETAEVATKLGHKNIYAIGAPWLYLRKSLNKSFQQPENLETRILLMPSHSQTDTVDASSNLQKKLRATEFRKNIGNFRATVCLHAIDFLDPVTRESFLDQGFEVTCLGLSGLLPPWTTSANRVRFLPTLVDLMRNHTHYATDAVATSLFYAIDMGLKIAVFPEVRDFFVLKGKGGSHILNEKESRESSAYRETHLSEAIGQFVRSESYLPFANNILGKECLLEPSELQEVLDYRTGIYPSEIASEPW